MTNQPDLRTALLTIRDASPPEGGLMDGVDTWSALVEELQKIAGDAVAGHDGAEEAGDCVSHRLFSEEKMLGGLRDWIKDSAPPKPAPDAMREALAKALFARRYPYRTDVDALFSKYANGDHNLGRSMRGSHSSFSQAINDAWLDADAVLPVSSAPVPPVDGTLEREALELAAAIDLGADLGTNGPKIRKRTTELLRALASPSGTGAAEPVAWWDIAETLCATDGNGFLQDCSPTMQEAYKVRGQAIVRLYANPPVRGDLEAIAQKLYEFSVKRIASEHFDEAPARSWDNADKAYWLAAVADALSLPVPPGAGEREKALRDEIFCLRQIVGDVRLLHAAGRLKEFNGEPWLRRAQNIDLIHDPIETARQAPHSSNGASERLHAAAHDLAREANAAPTSAGQAETDVKRST